MSSAKKTTAPAIIIIIIIIATAAAFALMNGSDDNSQQESTQSSEQITQAPQENVNEATSECVQGGECSLAEVAEHDSVDDCWIVYEDKVYDATGYTSEHPGGVASFDSSTCGSDIAEQIAGNQGSASQDDTHKHSSKDLRDLSELYFADLAQ